MSNVPTPPVRLKDIARDLDVSVMTVSKVVRGCADVGAETRGRVLARIQELNYQPNWVARSLAARRTFIDRKSTRLNSSHANISYAVFCLKKKSKANKSPHTSKTDYRQAHSTRSTAHG